MRFQSLRIRLLLLSLAALGCSQVQVETWPRPDTSFDSPLTYAQSPPLAADPSAPYYAAIASGQLQNEIAAQLDAKGLRRSTPDRADLMVSFRVCGVPHKHRENAGDSDVNYYADRRYIGLVVTIRLIDRRKDEELWKAAGATHLRRGVDVEAALSSAVEAILAELPAAAPVDSDEQAEPSRRKSFLTDDRWPRTASLADAC